MSMAKVETVADRIESAPKTVLFFAFAASILLFGLLLELAGMSIEAGLAGALSVILMGLAAIVHVGYWVLGRLD